jgi:hypothetical protein
MSPDTLVDIAVHWIGSTREQLRPRGQALAPERVQQWRRWFPAQVLESVRVVHVDSMREVSPPSVQDASGAPLPLPIALEDIAGLTLVDTICLSRERLRSAEAEAESLFQELVHATQFDRLGVAGFMTQYLAGWQQAAGRNERIPLEAQAELLRRRWASRPDVPFEVAGELERGSFDSGYRPAAAHAARPITSTDPVVANGWGLKRYAITADGGPVEPAFLEQATGLALRTLDGDADRAVSHGLAYCIAHAGRDGSYVIVAWWSGENMISQRLFARAPGKTGAFELFHAHHIVSCVWEVQVHAHESLAWIRHVLSRPETPDFDGYLGDTLNTLI